MTSSSRCLASRVSHSTTSSQSTTSFCASQLMGDPPSSLSSTPLPPSHLLALPFLNLADVAQPLLVDNAWSHNETDSDSDSGSHRPAVASRITKLLLPSYLASTKTPPELLRRLCAMLKQVCVVFPAFITPPPELFRPTRMSPQTLHHKP